MVGSFPTHLNKDQLLPGAWSRRCRASRSERRVIDLSGSANLNRSGNSRKVLNSHQRVPNRRSPASPSPGMMYPWSLSARSSAAQ